MTTHEFVSLLESNAEKALVFTAGQASVPAGYHVTEIKAATIHAMDCGGMATHWNETVLQVWPPSRATDEEPMSVAKFLGVYRRVARSVPIRGDAQVRVEYGAAGESAVSYVVSDVEVASRGIEVRLVAPAVACKGANRSVGDIPTAAPLASAQGEEAAACCAPAGTGAGASAARALPAAACCG